MFKAPFSFDGRIRRIEYFLSGIIGGVVSSIAWALGVGTFVLGAASGSAGGSVFGLLIGLAAMIASIWFSLAQGVKRLHDLNSRPLKSTHLRDIARKQCPADFFNK